MILPLRQSNIFILKKKPLFYFMYLLPACKCIHVGTLPMRKPEEAMGTACLEGFEVVEKEKVTNRQRDF